MDTVELWERYSGELTGYLQKNTGGFEEAEDIAAEVFLRVIKNKNTLKGLSEKQCRLWLYTTAKRIGIDLARKRKLESRMDILQAPELIEDDLSKIAVAQVLGELPEDLQDLVAMRYFADMDSMTIGRILGIPAATVRTRLRKACALLKKYWNKN